VLLVADQEQPVGAVTETVPVPPPLGSDALPGEIEYVQVIPLSVTVKVWPAMVKIPVSLLSPVLADAR
jgi:hypothetical protein